MFFQTFYNKLACRVVIPFSMALIANLYNIYVVFSFFLVPAIPRIIHIFDSDLVWLMQLMIIKVKKFVLCV